MVRQPEIETTCAANRAPITAADVASPATRLRKMFERAYTGFDDADWEKVQWWTRHDPAADALWSPLVEDTLGGVADSTDVAHEATATDVRSPGVRSHGAAIQERHVVTPRVGEAADALSTDATSTRLTRTDRPNLLWIMADDLGVGEPSFTTPGRMHTPNIDRLAAEGMRFTAACADRHGL